MAAADDDDVELVHAGNLSMGRIRVKAGAMFHVKHWRQLLCDVSRETLASGVAMFHVKHRFDLALMFHVKHRRSGRPKKHDSAKQPHALKNNLCFTMR